MIATYRVQPAHRRYDPLLDQGRRKKLSAGALVGIVFSILVHVGLIAWLWESKFQPHYQSHDDPGMKVDIVPVAPPPPPSQPIHLVSSRNPPPLAPHRALTPPVPTAERAPFPPIATPATETIDTPQVSSPSGRTAATSPPPPVLPPVLTAADFTVRPTSDDLQDLYPEGALREGRGGRAQMQCVVTDHGALAGCRILSETPAGLGFGDATLRAARLFKVHPATVNGRPVEARIVFPLEWRPPADE